MRTNKFLILFIVFIPYGCNTKEHAQTPLEILNEWKNDSLGCLHARTDSTFKIITDSITLKGKSYNEAILMLGQPNKVYRTDSNAVIRYFLNTRCGGTLTETECTARFDFENDTLYSFGTMCP